MEKAHSIGISLPGALGTYQYQSMQHGAQESTADKNSSAAAVKRFDDLMTRDFVVAARLRGPDVSREDMVRAQVRAELKGWFCRGASVSPQDFDSFSLMVRSAGSARASRTMAASAAPPGLSFETVGKSRPPQDEGVSAQSPRALCPRSY
jgi:hypothetical protein